MDGRGGSGTGVTRVSGLGLGSVDLAAVVNSRDSKASITERGTAAHHLREWTVDGGRPPKIGALRSVW